MVCILSPAVSYLLSLNSKTIFNGYEFGYEIVLVNGLITFGGLYLISKPAAGKQENL
jgi:hypothetical protein